MDFLQKLNPSSSHSVEHPNFIMTNVENDNFTVVSAKKRKLSTQEGEPESVSINEVLLSPNTSMSTEEFVFSINHILELIFKNCDRNSLLNSRLVSLRWANFGSKELQKTVSIRFGKWFSHYDNPPIFRFLSEENRSIEDLATLIDTSAEFPCNSFEFYSSEFDSENCKEIAQAFFNTHGAFVKKLTFRQDLYIEDLKHLLLNQAPNLQQLHLGPIDLYYRNSAEMDGETLFNETTSKQLPILKNLKIFKCNFSVDLPRTFVEQILECSPNLVEAELPCDMPCLLVQPKNYLHLLKRLNIFITCSNTETYELFANHLQDNGNLVIQELNFIGADIDDDDAMFQMLSERVTAVMRKILIACSAMCLKVSWEERQGVKFLQIPQMPRVNHLTIQYCNEDEETALPVYSLPGNVRLGDTFPNLKSLEIRNYCEVMDLPIPRIFSDDDPTPAANVKTVFLKLVRPGPKVLKSVMEMFPNASIRMKSYVGSGYGEGESIDSESECD